MSLLSKLIMAVAFVDPLSGSNNEQEKILLNFESIHDL